MKMGTEDIEKIPGLKEHLAKITEPYDRDWSQRYGIEDLQVIQDANIAAYIIEKREWCNDTLSGVPSGIEHSVRIGVFKDRKYVYSNWYVWRDKHDASKDKPSLAYQSITNLEIDGDKIKIQVASNISEREFEFDEKEFEDVGDFSDYRDFKYEEKELEFKLCQDDNK